MKEKKQIKNNFFKDCDVSKNIKVEFENPIYLEEVKIMHHTKIGQFSYMGKGALIGTMKEMGRYCSIAPGVKIGLGNHPIDYLSTHPLFFNSASMFDFYLKKNLMIGTHRTHAVIANEPIIGHDVWIGSDSIISRGVEIGHGAIIGANSFVNQNVPPYAIFAGNPAKLIKYRFSEEIIMQLLELQWWNLEIDLKNYKPYHDVEKIIEILKTYHDRANPEKLFLLNRKIYPIDYKFNNHR